MTQSGHRSKDGLLAVQHLAISDGRSRLLRLQAVDCHGRRKCQGRGSYHYEKRIYRRFCRFCHCRPLGQTQACGIFLTNVFLGAFRAPGGVTHACGAFVLSRQSARTRIAGDSTDTSTQKADARFVQDQGAARWVRASAETVTGAIISYCPPRALARWRHYWERQAAGA